MHLGVIHIYLYVHVLKVLHKEHLRSRFILHHCRAQVTCLALGMGRDDRHLFSHSRFIMFWLCLVLTGKLQQAEERSILVSVSTLIFGFGLCYPSKLQVVLPMSFKCIVSCSHQKV